MFKNSDFDLKYGPVYNPTEKNLRLGQLPLVLEEDLIRVGVDEFPRTKGLYELIFKKIPQNVDPEDLEHYRKIIHISGLHLDEKKI